MTGTPLTYFMEQVQFDDGVTWDESDMRTLYLDQHSTTGDDEIYGFWLGDTLDGGAGNDSIYGIGGDDTITGGAGDDFVEGDQGSDTYIYDLGDGNDTLQEWGDPDLATDTIAFGSGISASDITVAITAGTSDSLTLTNTLDGGSIEIIGQLGDPMMRVEQVVFADNTVWTADDMKEQVLAAQVTSGDDTIAGFYTDDIIHGSSGEDALYGGDGDDTLYGEADDDVLFGGDGDDTFVFATGDGYDWIADFTAGAGTDDVIDLTGVAGISDLSDVLASAYQADGFAVLDFGNDEGIGLGGVTLNTLHADDFRFAA